MRRAALALAGTIAGLVALLGYKSGSTPRRVAAVDPAVTTPPTSSAPGTQSTTTTAPAGPSPASQTVTGPDEPNQFGDVQVQLAMQGGHIVDVTALQLPQDRQRSAEISQAAGPLLQQEVLQAQSANIDVVSGATYTSESYAQSVQAALDQARQ